jgi:predicted glycosyltransferase involved in capsule biosynthesis
MNNILLVMKFWDDGQPDSTRVRNVNYTWVKLKELSKFLNENGIFCEPKLYDFSPEKIIEESIHIPYGLGEYKKSEKTNVILKENSKFNYVFMFDCDAFFLKNDYDKILEILKTLEEKRIVTFDLAKLSDGSSLNVVKNDNVDLVTDDFSYAYSGNKENGPLGSGQSGGLGGVYLCDISLIMENGGFDESYVGWGGEDGDMMNRIIISNMGHKQISIREFAPFHLSHFTDWGNEKYYKRFNE